MLFCYFNCFSDIQWSMLNHESVPEIDSSLIFTLEDELELAPKSSEINILFRGKVTCTCPNVQPGKHLYKPVFKKFKLLPFLVSSSTKYSGIAIFLTWNQFLFLFLTLYYYIKLFEVHFYKIVIKPVAMQDVKHRIWPENTK